VKKARADRKNMSLPEVLLWQALRKEPGGFKFRRQNPQLGYRLDFACLETRLAIEVDGEAHERGDRPKRDAVRDRRLAEIGFSTLRVPAAEILKDLDAVITGIVSSCRERGPLHRPSGGPPPRSGEEF
jgi:very-short-patch-repair endonuclease